MIVGTSIVPGMDAIAKHLGDSLSPLQITWGRFFFQCLLMGAAIMLLRGPRAFRTSIYKTHALRGLLLASATALFFWSLQSLPLADAIAIFFVQPMILTILSAVFLGEQIGWHRRGAVVAGFIGALFIIRPGGASFQVASLMPLGTAFLFSCYLALTRACAHVDPPPVMQFFSGISAWAALSILLLLLAAGSPESTSLLQITTVQWFWLFMIGVISAAGHLLVVMGMENAPASVLAPFGYVEIIAATLLGWFIFSDWPELWTWIGIMIIIASGIYVYYRERESARAATRS